MKRRQFLSRIEFFSITTCLSVVFSACSSQTNDSLTAPVKNNPTDNISTDKHQENLPESVKIAVLEAASERLKLPNSELKIIQAEAKTWNDGCLNLAAPDEMCTLALVPGWRVIVGNINQSLVYHTNQTGSIIRLNEQKLIN